MFRISNLTSGYGEKVILKDLNFECPRGQIRGVLGPNGAGKTTFFNSVFGFIKPLSGNVTLDESPIKQEQIAYLETDPYFYPLLTGQEYLNIFKIKNPTFDFEYWNRLFDLPLDNLIDTYSTGMRKKVALMGILAQEAEVLLLDEPFNGVDLETVESIYFILEKLRDAGKIVLLTSHVLPTLTSTCDQIHWLKDGHFFKNFAKADYPQLEQELQQMIRNHIEDRMKSE